jgi:hypothetical protein
LAFVSPSVSYSPFFLGWEKLCLFIDGPNYWTVYGQQGGKKITAEPTLCVSKNEGRANVTTPEEQAEFEANAKWIAQKEKHHYVEDVNTIEDETFFKVMLAKNYTDYKDTVKFPAILRHCGYFSVTLLFCYFNCSDSFSC